MVSEFRTSPFGRLLAQLLVVGTVLALLTSCGNNTRVRTIGHQDDRDGVVLPPANQAPVADAGPDQQVDAGATVTLDGSGSGDPDMDAITYSWTQTGGATVVLSSSTSSNPTFAVVQSPDTLTFQLVVNDGTVDSAPDTVTITVGAPPPAPVSFASDVYPLFNSLGCVFCHGGAAPAGGLALDGDAATTYQALLPTIDTGNPPASSLLTKPLASAAGGTAHGGGDFFMDTSDPDYVTILTWIQEGATDDTGNQPPVADAGADQNVGTGATVTLDGTGSSDPEMDPLTYQWTQTGGGAVTLSDSTAASPTFTAPGAADTLTFELVVNDGTQNSAPDTVTIDVAAGPAPVSFTNDVYPIFTTLGCVACHGGGAPSAGLALDGDAASTYAMVISRVDLADPPSSLLLLKPLATGAGGDPHGGGDLIPDTADANYVTILTWIQQGAVDDTGGGGGTSYAGDVHPIWAASFCTGCHGGGAPAAGLDLSGAAAATVAAVQGLSNTGAPATSLILTKPLAVGAGGDAHAGGDNFPDTADASYQTILAWITEGALDN